MVTEQLRQSEIFEVLQKLAFQQRALVQALYYFYPNSTSEKFLIDNLNYTSISQLKTLIDATNRSLSSLETNYRIVFHKATVSLTVIKPEELPPQTWSAFSSEERELLTKILANSASETIPYPKLAKLNYKLEHVMIGKIHRRNKGYYLENTKHLNTKQLLQSVTIFQQEHLMQKQAVSTADPESVYELID